MNDNIIIVRLPRLNLIGILTFEIDPWRRFFSSFWATQSLGLRRRSS